MDYRFQPKFKYTWNDPQFLTKYIPLPSAPPPKKSITLEIKPTSTLPPPPPKQDSMNKTELDDSHNTVFQFVSIITIFSIINKNFLQLVKLKLIEF